LTSTTLDKKPTERLLSALSASLKGERIGHQNKRGFLMSRNRRRIKRERETVELMIKLYCKNHHFNNKELCTECNGLLEYADIRLGKCPYKEEKPPCSKCPIHCYEPDYRTKIRSIMRYSGPRMLFRHPILAIYHKIDGSKKVKPLSKKS
jgi:hypothetical protein